MIGDPTPRCDFNANEIECDGKCAIACNGFQECRDGRDESGDLCTANLDREKEPTRPSITGKSLRRHTVFGKKRVIDFGFASVF